MAGVTMMLTESEFENASDEEKAAFIAYLERLAHRTELAARYSHPALLAKAINPGYQITPAVELVSKAVARCFNTPDGRLVVSAPPQELKSTLISVYTPLWVLQRQNEYRVMMCSYSESLAKKHAAEARRIVRENGSDAEDVMTGARMEDRLGFGLDQHKQAEGHWQVAGEQGGLFAVGVGGSATGRSADFLIIDDPVKNMEDADSPRIREKTWDWLESVAMTRLAGGASVVCVQTRWNIADVAGRLIKMGWPYINIPAIAEQGIPDALGRPHGEAMISARGRSQKDFEMIRDSRTSRVWYALYQGAPTPVSGGLFTRTWFDTRVPLEPAPELTRRVVALDPAESGGGDEAGLVACGVRADGVIVVTHDRSAHYTSQQWAAAAIQLVIDTRATDLVFEAYTAATTYERVLKLAWFDYAEDHGIDPAYRPFRITAWKQRGNAEARSVGLRHAVEKGKCVTWAAHLAELEEQACNWMPGQHCPDRVAALIVAFETLQGRGTTTSSPAVGQWGVLSSGISAGPDRNLIQAVPGSPMAGMGRLPDGFGGAGRGVPSGFGPSGWT